MALAPGTRLGPFEVTAQIGVGGMGEVYRATDTNLGRTVAIKVLPEAVASDAERLARFDREAKTLAALNHPNIAAVYGFERSKATKALVMELVEGPTLADRIGRGPIPVHEALPIAKQIAEALEAAHEQGIIHRDLKPANVKVRPDGMVKVLDFGLAKAMQPPGAESPGLSQTVTTPAMTQAGVVLGTAAYMSPEQARGKPVDRRADIWAFGCVLFEALSGQRPFAGGNITEVLAAIIHEAPDLGFLPSETPLAIRTLVRRCLEKDPHLRLRDIGDARIVLHETVTGTTERMPDPRTAVPWSFRKTVLAAAGSALLLALAGVIGWTLKPRAELPFRKFDLAVENLQSSFAISPDGKSVVYVAENRLWLRELDQLEPRKLSDTQNFSQEPQAGRSAPFWSPDSTWIGYASPNKIWKVPVHGGAGTAVTAGSLQVFENATWTPDGRILFAASMQGKTGLLEVSAQGGEPRTLLDIDRQGGDLDFHDPHVLPDGRGVLFIVHRAQYGNDTLALYTGKERRTLLQLAGQSLGSPVYSPTGHVLFQQGTANPSIWALPFSLSTLGVGEPFLIAPDAARPSLAKDGTLVYIHGSERPLWQLVWVDRQGVPSRPVIEIRGSARLQLSPDGGRVAIGIETGVWLGDIWLLDLGREVLTRLTFDGRSWYPRWTPDGKQVAYASTWERNVDQLYVRAADGGEARRLTSRPNRQYPTSWSPDGRFLAFTEISPETDRDVYILPLDGAREPRAFVSSRFAEEAARFSPDGKWLAYVSNEPGQDEVYVRSFPGPGGLWQISAGGGRQPVWAPDGRELFYRKDEQMMVVSIESEPSFRAGKPRFLFSGSYGAMGTQGPMYDVSPDGQRFLMLKRAGQAEEAPRRPNLVVVLNWLEEFKRPVANKDSTR